MLIWYHDNIWTGCKGLKNPIPSPLPTATMPSNRIELNGHNLGMHQGRTSRVNGEDPPAKQQQKVIVPLRGKKHQSELSIICEWSSYSTVLCWSDVRRPPKSEMPRIPRRVAQFWCELGVDAIRDNSSFSTSHAFKQLSCKHQRPCSHGNKSNESSEWSPQHLPFILIKKNEVTKTKCQNRRFTRLHCMYI